MLWEGSRSLLWGSFWLHIASYVGYSSLVKDKDTRIIYPLSILLLVFILSNIDLNWSPLTTNIVGLLLMYIYISIHLFIPGYLAQSSSKKLKTASLIIIALCITTLIFKVMQFPMVSEFLIVSCLSLALMLLILGVSKGMVKNSTND